MKPEKLTDPGLPRPMEDFSPYSEVPKVRLPVPWINAPSVEASGDWLSFRPGHEACYTEKVCVYCGEPMRGTIVFARYYFRRGSRHASRYTNGPGGHPHCMRIAVAMCPHLKGIPADDVVAYAYTGPGTGLVTNDAALNEQSEHQVSRTAIALDREGLHSLAKRAPFGIEQ